MSQPNQDPEYILVKAAYGIQLVTRAGIFALVAIILLWCSYSLFPAITTWLAITNGRI